MKNPLKILRECYKHWQSFAGLPRVFSLSDATMQFNRVIVPARFHNAEFARKMRQEIDIRTEPDGAVRFCHRASGLCFLLPQDPGPNAWAFIEQEFSPHNPHHYLTAPISIGPESTVLDIGACEGLFAFRVLSHRLAKKVVCFEPSAEMCRLIQRGAEYNGLTDGLAIECQAVSNRVGRVRLNLATNAEANSIQNTDDSDPGSIPCTSIDSYCTSTGLLLGTNDLLKIDAEGADLDVLRGGERTIRSRKPQIAVTTYHSPDHPVAILSWLKELNPSYRFRLKGFSHWTSLPTPVLLLASDPSAQETSVL